MPDAVTLLTEDHATLRRLMTQLIETPEGSPERREQLLAEIATSLQVHTSIEEEIFYPAMRSSIGGKAGEFFYEEATEEHHIVDMVLPEIQESDADSVRFEARVKVLQDLVEHHMEEEEHEIFPKVQQIVSAEELAELGARLLERKEALMGETPTGQLDLNQASEEELATVPGISAARAAKLAGYRDEHGPFASWDDVLAVPGFDTKLLEKLRSAATLGSG